MNFEKQNVIITGGATGLGFQIAKILAQNGAKVTVCGRREQKLVQAKQECPALNIFRADICVKEDRKALFEAARDFGGDAVSLLINNAGIFAAENEKLTHMKAVNFEAPIELTKLFLEQSKPQGTVVQIASLAGLIEIAPLLNYGKSKALLIEESQKLREFAKQKDCQVSIVYSPGFESEMTQNFNVKKANAKTIASSIVRSIKLRKEDIYPNLESRLAGLGMQYVPKLTTYIANRRYKGVKL